MFNIGDVVLYSIGGEMPVYKVCLIVSIKNDTYSLLWKNKYDSFHTLSGVGNESLTNINEVDNLRVKTDIYFNNMLKNKLKELREISLEDKEQEQIARYNDIKKRIIANCNAIVDYTITEEEFVNRTKELASLKKQLFSPEKLECVSLIHKHNGKIKYEYKKIKENYKKALDSISEDEINMFLESIGR